MSFASISFAFLFLVVLLGRLTLGRDKRGSAYFLFLLSASLVFYSWHIPIYLVLLVGVSWLNYFVAARLGAAGLDPARKKRWVRLALIGSLGTLGVFKYLDFCLRSVGFAVSTLGIGSPNWGVDLALPIGISFYTFQSLSYVIDVYRGELKHRSSFSEFLLYVSFFPQLVAGPIVRAKDFFYQWNRRRRLSWPLVSEACFQLISGFFFKLVIADGLANIVDGHWGERSIVNGLLGIGGLTLLFGGQIFADFAGYSMIARGLAYLLGFRLPLNFDAPYIASSLQEFWRRWHISLSTWLRDYLYVPLGGNRNGNLATMRNVFLVMLLGGIWHGAGMPFILWGVVHGFGLLIEKALGIRVNHSGAGLGKRIGWYLVTQTFVFTAWMIFRMESSMQLIGMVQSGVRDGWGLSGLLELQQGLIFLLPILGLHLRRLFEVSGRIQPATQTEKACWAGVMMVFILTAYAQGTAFIYFQF